MEYWFKQKTRPRVNYEWIRKTIQKNVRSKKFFKKTVKIEVKLPHVNKKALARKQNFVQTTVFSLPVSAWPKSTSKNHENVWTDLEKK